MFVAGIHGFAFSNSEGLLVAGIRTRRRGAFFVAVDKRVTRHQGETMVIRSGKQSRKQKKLDSGYKHAGMTI